MIECNKCGQLKNTTEFRKSSINKCGTKGICKQCKNDQNKVYWKSKYKDPEFKVKHEARQIRYKDQKAEYMKQYDVLNREKKHQWHYNKYQNDIEYKLISRVRNRIYYALKTRNENKQYKSSEHLGCDIKTYIQYLENQFDKNMNWENYGTYWEIDHIVCLNQGGPLHYTNTRPLEILANRRRKKGKRNAQS